MIGDGVAYYAASRGPIGLDIQTGAVVWRGDTETYGTAGPAYRDGTLYSASEHTLTALDTQSGDVQWEFQAGGSIDAAPTIHADTIYVPSKNATLYALDTQTGTQTWTYDTNAHEITTSPTIAHDTVYVTTTGDDTTHALETDTGTERWRFEHGAHRTRGPSPIAAPTAIYIPYLDTIYSLDPETGDLRDSYETTDRITTTPCLHGDTIYYGTRDHHVHATHYDTGVQSFLGDFIDCLADLEATCVYQAIIEPGTPYEYQVKNRKIDLELNDDTPGQKLASTVFGYPDDPTMADSN